MACVSVCPPQAVLVDQGNQEWHEKASGTFKKVEAGTANPHSSHSPHIFLLYFLKPLLLNQILKQILGGEYQRNSQRSPSSVGRGP